MEREEAIKILMGYSYTPQEREALETLIPELTESEDERIRKAILGLAYLDGIEPILTKCSVTRSDILSYLEKQKEQKPAEWSEEDERTRQNLMSLLANMRGERIKEETYNKYYPWLKSLRSGILQNGNTHWKPSEEQMKALQCAIVFMEIRKASDYDISPLKSLYEDLHKLI